MEKYAIVNEKGEILEKFRLLNTAYQWISKMKPTRTSKVEVIELDD